MTDAVVTQYLADFRPFPFDLHETRLEFALSPRATKVQAQLDFARRDIASQSDLVLDGGAGLRLIALTLDGAPLPESAWQREGDQLIIQSSALPAEFTLGSEVEIDPESNLSCEGLYLSGDMFCTQCEAEGFRQITFYPDRPDVMAPFRVRIDSDMPVLLSNGNPVGGDGKGVGAQEWHDPWPKPAYLFALVAGDLRALSQNFTTRSGRDVVLNVWVRPGDLDRADFAMESLVKSMRWDEETYGREYDLDVFNIVAVDDFNMGAMENKGLNIFNSKLVLAAPDTATDADYERIESVIAHEYFHNWTGNRITCRDWFQLCLKEGLTVFRDQQFTSDLRAASVKRIEDVKTLRARQFQEDAGPLAHPPRPDHYQEINNFYTATVYEKGAEVIGMLRRLVGADGYRAALDLYFARHDGDAATIEDWLQVFEDATGRDLSQFKRWYTDAGTPDLTMTEDWDQGSGCLTLRFAQSTAPTPGQRDKMPRIIPIDIGLIGTNGDEIQPTQTLELTQTAQEWRFEGLSARPVVSALRGFSAPVRLHRDLSRANRALLFSSDTDPYARWQAGQELMLDALITNDPDAHQVLIDAVGGLLQDAESDPALTALALTLPSESVIAEAIATSGTIPDPDAIHAQREALSSDLAQAHHARLAELYAAMEVPGPYRPDPAPAGQRALRGTALALLSRLDHGARAQALWDAQPDMTQAMAALSALIRAGRAETALADMRTRFGQNRLVMDKWFMIQPMLAPGSAAPDIAADLAQDADFDWHNPNRYRALLGGLAANPAGFHRADGAGYRFFADWLLKMDSLNPQITARMSGAFETWTRFDATRQAQAKAQLERMRDTPDLSRNLNEMVIRLLSAANR